MKIAIVHDWLITYAGAERALEQMLICFPEADLFAVVDFFDDDLRKQHLQGKKAVTTFIQKLPFARSKYRSYLSLMPLAVEQLDLSNYDLIISSSHAVAKGVITSHDQVHLSYVYSPMRYAWDLQHQYLREAYLTKGIKSWIARYMLHKMRMWDLRTVNGVDKYIGISSYISRRIRKIYRREAEIIYPPVNVAAFSLRENKEDFYFTASRMVPYKKISLIVEAFAQLPNKKLVVIGDGPEMKRISKLAKANVVLLGYQPFSVLLDYMQRAKCFIFAAEEDFGIAPLEAQACGTPVVAYGKGGCLETIVAGDNVAHPTGLFFKEQSIGSLLEAIAKFEGMSFDPHDCRNNALYFSEERFRDAFKKVVDEAWLEHQKGIKFARQNIFR